MTRLRMPGMSEMVQASAAEGLKREDQTVILSHQFPAEACREEEVKVVAVGKPLRIAISKGVV
jgi:RNase H-fold protein (predicted Holliday junction resolvase)